MKKYLLLFGLLSFITLGANAQVTWTNASSNLNFNTVYSGAPSAIADMNGDGLDDIVRLNNGRDLRIDYQHPSGNFTGYSGASHGSGCWGMVIADIDENGYYDILAGGAYNNISRWTANGSGTSYTRTNLGGPSIFVQNLNFADIDNDGSIDFFACHDDGISSPYENNGSGTLTHNASLINTASTVPSDNSGNYGSIWTDYDDDGDLDLYISKCRLGVNNANDGRRLNLLFQNDGSGNFTDVAPAAGLQPMRQSWAAGFGDLDNDGDQDVVLINHGTSSQIFSNDGDGTFTDITATSGISTQLSPGLGRGIQVIMADFDNDGFLDFILTTRDGNHYLFYNDGDMTFTASSPFLSGSTDMHSGAVGDLNNDGFMDVLASFGTNYNSPVSTRPDRLFLNNGNSNHWSKIKLTGVQTNRDAVGAKVILEGSWGEQMREVRAGESYGTQNTMVVHFGIGSASSITKLTVEWPSGVIDEILNPAIDQLINIQEGETCQTTTTWDGLSWDNGTPTDTTRAIIDGNYNTATDGNIETCILEVEAGATLTIGALSYADIKNNVIVNTGGTIDILDDGSLRQQEDGSQAVNNGTIRVFKETPSLNNRDFMIVGSPMTASTKTGVFPSAVQFRNHLTGNFNADPDVTAEDGAALNFADAEGDNWLAYTGSLTNGEGYLVMPQTSPTVPDGQTYMFEFNQGTLNNGIVNIPVLFGDDSNDSPNVLSNPYASAIDADLWLAENSGLATVIYLWDHATAPSVTYPGYNGANYDMGDISTYSTGSGGVAGNGGIIPDGYLASGQGFAIKALAAGTAEFNNSMRVTGNNTGFKSSPASPVGRDRIWLNVESREYGLKSQTLIAFVEGASSTYETTYDATRLATPVSIYSKLSTGEELSIQGLEAFDLEQRVNLGFRSQIEAPEIFTISIERLERYLMTEQTQVYLEDRQTGDIINLSETNYSFRSDSGNFADRFTLLFNEKALNVDDYQLSGFSIYPNPAENSVTIDFGTNTPKSAFIYDISGRMVLTHSGIDQQTITVDVSRLNSGIYFVKVGDTTQKLIIK